MTNSTGYIRGIYTNPNISVYRHATPAARCPPPAARASLNVTKPSQNVTYCSKMSQRRRAARAGRRMLATPRPPRGARRLRVIECHRTVTECHILPQTVTEPPCRARQAAHARQATPAARRPPPGARASLNVTKTTHNVTGCHRLLQNVTEPPCHTRQAAHARHATPAARRPPPGARASLNVTKTTNNVT